MASKHLAESAIVLAILAISGASGQESIYDGCNVTKGCLGAPEYCLDDQSCSLLATYVRLADTGGYMFELMGTSLEAEYMSVGLSDNAKMGDDSVVLCSTFNGEARVEQYWTRGFPKSAMVLADPNTGIDESSTDIVDGKRYCSFTRTEVTDIINPYTDEVTQFDLVSKRYHLLLASGPLDEEGVAKKHTDKFPSPEPVNFNEFLA